MNKSTIFMIFLFILFLLSTIPFTSYNHEKFYAHTTSVPSGEAAYIGFGSLKEIRQKSDLIIVGRPYAAAEQRKYGVISNVQVISTLKGNKLDEIKLYQIGSIQNREIEGDVLEFGKNYLLFLLKEYDGQPDTFSIAGGIQGVLRIEPDGRLTSRHPLIRQEVQTISFSKKEKREVDALIEFALQSSERGEQAPETVQP